MTEIVMATMPHQLIDGLQNPAIYPGLCTNVQLVETHISWVLLTGSRAYKIKKPVNLGFVDFTPLERRRHFCKEELRLNRRLAPQLYLSVVPITGAASKPEIDGTGPIIDYAVCMTQFDQNCLLSRLSPNELRPDHIDDLADQCARFHNEAPVADSCSACGLPEQIMQPVRDNFAVLRDADKSIATTVKKLAEQAEYRFTRLQNIFADRKQDGRIRECHGDLHLGNMFLNNDRITVFDGIEFSDDLRWIDVMNDVAFAVMDFEERGHSGLSRRFLNRWLERTGDYFGLNVLSFYSAYRAAVRAKIDTIQMHQPHQSLSDLRSLAKECCAYLSLSESCTRWHRPSLIITMGASGSGKTTVTQHLIESTNAIRIRSDVERKRLKGLQPEQASSRLSPELYSAESTEKTYDRLALLATQVIEAGFPAVIDATFLQRSQRSKFADLAGRLGVPFLIIKCEADVATLKARIKRRRIEGRDASEADERILSEQLNAAEPLSVAEDQRAIDSSIDSLPSVVEHLMMDSMTP